MRLPCKKGDAILKTFVDENFPLITVEELRSKGFKVSHRTVARVDGGNAG
jgi:hypothetical protein